MKVENIQILFLECSSEIKSTFCFLRIDGKKSHHICKHQRLDHPGLFSYLIELNLINQIVIPFQESDCLIAKISFKTDTLNVDQNCLNQPIFNQM